MEWEFRDVRDGERAINAAMCATQTPYGESVLIGFQNGYRAVYLESPDDGLIIVYVERPLAVTSTILADGRIIDP